MSFRTLILVSVASLALSACASKQANSPAEPASAEYSPSSNSMDHGSMDSMDHGSMDHGSMDSMDHGSMDSMDHATIHSAHDAKSAESMNGEPPVSLDNAAAADVTTASAKLQSTSDSDVTGTVTFKESITPGSAGSPARTVAISYDLHGLTPGAKHGFHIHQKGDCSASDGSSAGGHFNPQDHDHGAPKAQDSHAGDFGNITADSDGNATGTIKNVTKITLDDGSENNVIGRAVIVHADEDDLTSQPTGDAGGRVACGVIKAQMP